jgi:hypothetical protein
VTNQRGKNGGARGEQKKLEVLKKRPAEQERVKVISPRKEGGETAQGTTHTSISDLDPGRTA